MPRPVTGSIGPGTSRLPTSLQESQVTTKTGKAREPAAKHLATEELSIEKARIEKSKKKVMEEVAHEMRGMRQAQEKEMETQRKTFQVELENVTEELKKVKLRSTALEKRLKISKAQKSAQKQNYAQEMLGAKEVAMAKKSRPEKIVEIRESRSTKSSQRVMDTTLIS